MKNNLEHLVAASKIKKCWMCLKIKCYKSKELLKKRIKETRVPNIYCQEDDFKYVISYFH